MGLDELFYLLLFPNLSDPNCFIFFKIFQDSSFQVQPSIIKASRSSAVSTNGARDRDPPEFYIVTKEKADKGLSSTSSPR